MSKTVKCLKCSIPMKEVLTKRGVLIDICSYCKGVWLDQGELNFFTADRKILNDYETRGLENTHKINYQCPKCDSEMQLGRIPGYSYQVEECLSCRGLFFDAHEFKKIEGSKSFQTLRQDSSGVLTKEKPKNILPPVSVKLPSLFSTMGAVCFSLYGILFAVIVFFMEFTTISLQAGSFFVFVFILIQFYFSPIVLDWQLKLFGSLDWKGLEDLPESFKKSLLRLCKENHIPIPKVGIIRDSSPQAYTYGRTPHSARLVFSLGMFELLDEEELSAVLAHELGHIKHWDFVVMTVVRLVPLLLYIIYRNVRDQLLKKENRKDKKTLIHLSTALVISYLAYLITEYLVLFVSRIREYYADRFSCFATRQPNKLVTALVKVSYGLLSSHSESDSEKGSYQSRVKGIESLNIMNISRSKELALVNQNTENKEFTPESLEEVMKWDLWSPWAFYYELNSTHPLTAKRINAIGSYAMSMKQEPYLIFKQEKPESYWDDFFQDVFIVFLPYILGIGSILFWFISKGYSYKYLDKVDSSGKFHLFLLALFCFSAGAFIRTLKAYPHKRFLRYSVSSLLKLIKVSPVRSYAVQLKGFILGRGDAGNVFSEDFVLKDKTGMIFLNHEPFGLNILFSLFRYKHFQGKEVVVTGWYRRSPSPYVEVKEIRTAGTVSKAYTYNYKMALCIVGLLIPLLLGLF